MIIFIKIKLNKYNLFKIFFYKYILIMNNDLYVGSDLLCSVGDIVSVKVDSVKYKTGEIIFLLDKNLKKEYGLNGKKKSKKKIKVR